MAHHSTDDPLGFADLELRRKLAGEYEKLGPTGRFPEGHYGPHDEGELKLGIAADVSNGKVLIDFGKPIRSIGFTAVQARELAAMLNSKAEEVSGQ